MVPSAMTAQGEIIVISPHLDDAVLDCSDHILAWKEHGLPVRVVTVFTKLLTPSPEGGSHESPADLERIRMREDRKAMGLLGVSSECLGFADWAFRHKGKSPDRIDQAKQNALSDPILGTLKTVIMSFRNRGLFVVPLGIGRHVDHVLVREAAEVAIEPTELCYYVDYPYALSIINWTGRHVLKVIGAKKSIRIMSKKKKQLLETYRSQIPQIFSHTRFSMPWITWAVVKSYPEIVLYHRRTRLRPRK